MSDLGLLSAAITDLTARVEQLDADVHRSGSAGNVESRLSEVEAILASVRKTVTRLANDRAADDQKRELRKPWDELTAPQAERRWLDLRAWVDQLVDRNTIGQKEIPNCWYRHGGLVDELEALRWAWLDAYRPTGRGIDPLTWREALHRARSRWPLFNVNGCAKTHTDPSPRSMVSDTDWRNFLAEDLGARAPEDTARALMRQRPPGQWFK